MVDDTRGKHDEGKLLYCSFCGKSQHEVRKLIAGPSVFVCDECVELCNDIIREELEEKQERSRDKLLQAVLLDPTVNSYRRAVEMVQEMCRLQAPLLPFGPAD